MRDNRRNGLEFTTPYLFLYVQPFPILFKTVMCKLFVLLSFSMMLLMGCDYDPHGENFVTLPTPDSSGIKIELVNITSDTLYLFGRAKLSYKALVAGKEIERVYAVIGDRSFGAEPAAENDIVVETIYMNDGTYNMNLEIIVASGTGSLAEMREKESFRISKKYVVVIDNSVPDPVKFTTIQNIDGTLEVAWEKYKKNNFSKYRITKYCYNQGYKYYQVHWIKEVSDKSKISFRDSTFVGGQAIYNITVDAGAQRSTADEREYISTYAIDMQWEWVDKTNIKLTWRKAPFYKNLTSYVVKFSVTNDLREFKITNANDTVLIFDAQLKYPQVKYLLLIAYPLRIDTYHPDYIYESKNFYLGTPFPDRSGNKLTYNQSLDKYYIIQSGRLLRVDGSTNLGEDTVATSTDQFAVSENGQYVYTSKANTLTAYDPMDFSNATVYDLSTRINSNIWDNRTISVSNTNKIAIADGSKSYIIDMNNYTAVQSWIHSSGGDNRIWISPGGNYMLRQGIIYTWGTNQFVETGTYNKTSLKNVVFKKDEKLILSKYGSIEIMDLASGTLERTVLTGVVDDLTYDPVTDLLGGGGIQKSNGPYIYYLYSLTGTEPLKQLEIGGGLLLANSNLIYSGGLTIPLSFFYP
jgi:hypothetical protein